MNDCYPILPTGPMSNLKSNTMPNNFGTTNSEQVEQLATGILQNIFEYDESFTVKTGQIMENITKTEIR